MFILRNNSKSNIFSPQNTTNPFVVAQNCSNNNIFTHAHNLMDSVFFLNEGDRSTFLQTMMQAFGSTYIILWSYESNQPFK